MELRLNGIWEIGEQRQYEREAEVPGLAGDPGEVNRARLWYKREIWLPEGDWSHATLLLKGARFCPAVYVNGEEVSKAEGGMTYTTHPLQKGQLVPGSTITLEVALKPLSDVSPENASYIPKADQWRTNISSCLWDDVILKLHGGGRFSRVIPHGDLEKDELHVRWEIELYTKEAVEAKNAVYVQLLDDQGFVVAEGISDENYGVSSGSLTLKLNSRCRCWSPEEPVCYRLKVRLILDDKAADEDEMTFGFKQFRTEGKRFLLNGRPVTFRAGSVVWHRWVRDPEASRLAFDVDWFEENIVLRLKSHGANGLRFHLGTPPESFLDLCDRLGLLVQMEWHFFHGMTASKSSLLEQWRCLLDLCMRHPCVCIIHLWNETEGEELQTAFSAIAELEREYPPIVVSHRDVLHVHKYWWSMFENVGLYYDSAEQFPMPIVADEFGGNYLDGDGNPGRYPMLQESFLRFLGRGHTKELRLQLHCESNTQVAEYWRRIGAAGFSPFCALGSPEDGNHHFLGKLAEGRPKEVWAGLTAAFAPQSVSLEVWDRNAEPGGIVTLPVHFFNETADTVELTAKVALLSEERRTEPGEPVTLTCLLAPYSAGMKHAVLRLPEEEGEWRYEATLLNLVSGVKHPIVSSWRFRTIRTKTPESLKAIKIAVPEAETELRMFLNECGLTVCGLDDPQAGIIFLSVVTWEVFSGNVGLQDVLAAALNRGCSIVMTGIGPKKLGQGYPENAELGPLQEQPRVEEPRTEEVPLFRGIKLRFKELPEPESCLHPADDESSCVLWNGLPKQATWLWNGLRGGLIVPAYDMEPIGLNPSAFLSIWQSRGADPQRLTGGDYYAYELAGFYEYSTGFSQETMQSLREKVKHLVADAPALQHVINPHAKINTFNLSELYEGSRGGEAESLSALALCGKSLTRSPIVEMSFGHGKGKLILAQILINGRLAEPFGEPGLYGIRHDPAVCQFVLNLLEKSIIAIKETEMKIGEIAEKLRYTSDEHDKE